MTETPQQIPFKITRWWDDLILFESTTAKTILEALREAILHEADLRGADLRGANLRGAILREADLRGANLRGAILHEAILREADLRGANLRGADLVSFRRDIELILYENPREVTALLGALESGRIDGSCYTGDCCCLVGTIAKTKGCQVDDLVSGRDSSRPAEVWFLGIGPGDTPDKSPIAQITVEWVKAWLARQPVELIGA